MMAATRILAHYMAWFEAKPFQGHWGWHWTMNGFDPERVVDGKRQIASHYYPVIGPYNSADPDVIEYHLLLMKLAGIDGVMVDWYGRSDLYDYPIIHRNTAALLPIAARLGLFVGVCYEDMTIVRLIEQKRLAASDRVAHARREIDWLRANWFTHPAYLTLNKKPVLLSFGYDGLTEDEWSQVLGPDSGGLCYLSELRRRKSASGSFDWPQPSAGLAAVESYYAAIARPDPGVTMPVAFPRFDDCYKEGNARPGFPKIDDNNGKTLRSTLRQALTSRAPLVQLATWNDWGEGTSIEPSLEFGTRDLEAIQSARRQFIDARFRHTPADLALPLRLWNLRHRPNPPSRAELDRIAPLVADGKTAEARALLTRLESASS